MNVAFKINNPSDYGLLIAYCIENDVCVFRTYLKIGAVYRIDFNEKRCYYSDNGYFENNGYRVVEPTFYFDKYGTVKLANYNSD